MKTLEEFTAYYAKQHTARIHRQIKKEKAARNPYQPAIDRFTEEIAYYSPDNPVIINRCQAFYDSIATKNPENLCHFKWLNGSAAIWKTVCYTLGIPTFKTDKELRKWMQDYYGENYTTWCDTLRIAREKEQAEKEKKNQESQKQWEAQEAARHERDLDTTYINSMSVRKFVNQLFQEGYKPYPYKQGFATTLRVEKRHPETGERLESYPTPRSKRKANLVHVWNNLVIRYLSKLCAESTTTPTPPEEEEEISPEIARLFNPVNTVNTVNTVTEVTTPTEQNPEPKEPTNILQFPTPTKQTPSLTDRFPLLNKFKP